MRHNYPPFRREHPAVAEKTIDRGRTWLTGGRETIDDGNPKKAPNLTPEVDDETET